MMLSKQWYGYFRCPNNIVYDGDWNGDDLNTALDEVQTRLDASDQPVDIIADFRKSSTFPHDPSSQFTRWRQFWQNEELGFGVVIGIHPVLKFFLTLFIHTMPSVQRKIHFADSLYGAEILLETLHLEAEV
jgi:hypothetical protein